MLSYRGGFYLPDQEVLVRSNNPDAIIQLDFAAKL